MSCKKVVNKKKESILLGKIMSFLNNLLGGTTMIYILFIFPLIVGQVIISEPNGFIFIILLLIVFLMALYWYMDRFCMDNAYGFEKHDFWQLYPEDVEYSKPRLVDTHIPLKPVVHYILYPFFITMPFFILYFG